VSAFYALVADCASINCFDVAAAKTTKGRQPITGPAKVKPV